MGKTNTFLKKLENQNLTGKQRLKIIFCLIFLISVLSQGRFDPTPFNLMVPPEGINNFFGLPGALLGGLLLDFFGISVVLLPLIFLSIRKSEQSESEYIGIKIILVFLMLNCALSAFFYRYTANFVDYFGVFGLTSYQFFDAYLNPTMGIILLVLLTSMYVFINFQDIEFDWMISYLLIIVAVAIGRSINYFWINVVNIFVRLFDFISKHLSNSSNRLFEKYDIFFQQQKKNLIQHIKRTPIKLKIKPIKKAKRPPLKGAFKRKAERPLKFHSKTKQLLHQAIEVYQKTNYPGNDTAIKTLDN
jgi:hypothetical protein